MDGKRERELNSVFFLPLRTHNCQTIRERYGKSEKYVLTQMDLVLMPWRKCTLLVLETLFKGWGWGY